ncbi:MAG: glutamine-hydrolyzing GMP synthase [Anaerolineae bacterium]|nr:glutamine-hydrolyzing GMP synthase [Anaerolineae bacterium]
MLLKSGGIVILDFGSQTAQLIARRVRAAGVYAALLPYEALYTDAQDAVPDFRGIILSGGPASVYVPQAPQLPGWVLESGVPVLGICYGMQLLAHQLGGKVSPAPDREFGFAELAIWENAGLFEGLLPQERVWMSHGDHVEVPPAGFTSLAKSPGAPYAAMGDPQRGWYAVQFHPEVTHTVHGQVMLHNFVIGLCGAAQTWNPHDFIDASVASVQAQVGEGRVLLGLSGGVDSAVAGALLQKALGDRVVPVFVNHGLMRVGEAEAVVRTFGTDLKLNLHAVDATEEFLSALAGVTDPEEKRQTIGRLFVETFEAAAQHVGAFQWLGQGTIYPDVIESAGTDRPGAQRIKSHHNVGGLPVRMQGRVVEPLRDLFKDEVREVGTALGLPDEIVWRQPFPGPGLAIRCLGEVTWERLETLRRADDIFTSELRIAGLLRNATAQAFAVLLPVKSVGVMGDGRTYEEVVALRAVATDDFMTADWARLPNDLLARVANRIVNEVRGVNRVVYDITSKPPATIEWE